MDWGDADDRRAGRHRGWRRRALEDDQHEPEPAANLLNAVQKSWSHGLTAGTESPRRSRQRSPWHIYSSIHGRRCPGSLHGHRPSRHRRRPRPERSKRDSCSTRALQRGEASDPASSFAVTTASRIGTEHAESVEILDAPIGDDLGAPNPVSAAAVEVRGRFPPGAMLPGRRATRGRRAWPLGPWRHVRGRCSAGGDRVGDQRRGPRPVAVYGRGPEPGFAGAPLGPRRQPDRTEAGWPRTDWTFRTRTPSGRCGLRRLGRRADGRWKDGVG